MTIHSSEMCREGVISNQRKRQASDSKMRRSASAILLIPLPRRDDVQTGVGDDRPEDKVSNAGPLEELP